MLIKRHGLGHIPVMNQFSAGLYALLKSEALLCTTLLPLEIHLQDAKEKAMLSVSEYVHHMWS